MELLIALFFAVFILLFLVYYRFWFLRNPKRTPPLGNYIISPADGKVNQIIRSSSEDAKISKGIGKIHTLASDVDKEYLIVNIVMTPFDVHYQRSPIEGKVLYTKYNKGKFRNAVTDKIAIENENNEILISGKHRVKVIQIAGILARRIKCFVKKKKNLKAGDIIGLITLGSQVTLIMPAGIKLNVREGERVKAGETIIAKDKK